MSRETVQFAEMIREAHARLTQPWRHTVSRGHAIHVGGCNSCREATHHDVWVDSQGKSHKRCQKCGTTTTYQEGTR